MLPPVQLSGGSTLALHVFVEFAGVPGVVSRQPCRKTIESRKEVEFVPNLAFLIRGNDDFSG